MHSNDSVNLCSPILCHCIRTNTSNVFTQSEWSASLTQHMCSCVNPNKRKNFCNDNDAHCLFEIQLQHDALLHSSWCFVHCNYMSVYQYLAPHIPVYKCSVSPLPRRMDAYGVRGWFSGNRHMFDCKFALFGIAYSALSKLSLTPPHHRQPIWVSNFSNRKSDGKTSSNLNAISVSHIFRPESKLILMAARRFIRESCVIH